MSSGEGPRLSAQVNRGIAWAAASQAIIAVTDLVSYGIVVALLVPTGDIGIAAAAMTYWALLDTAADFGVTSALIQRDDHTPERVSTVFWFNVLVSSGLFVFLLIVGPIYGFGIGTPVVGWLLIAYGGKLLLQNVYAIPFALLRKELRFDDIAKARIVAHTLESIARVVFAYVGWTIWCWTLAALTRAFVFGVIIQIRHPFVPKLAFQIREVLPYIRFGLRSAASQILFRFYVSIDVSIALAHFGNSAAGVYALAVYIVLEPVKTISNVVIDVAFPTFAQLRNDPDGLAARLIQFTRLNLLAVLPVLVLIWLVIPEALRLFVTGQDWTPDKLAVCADATRILCIVGILRALGYLGPPLLDGVGRPELTLRYMIVATLAVPGSFLLGSWLLGDELGVVSLAVSWAAGYPLAFAALAYLVVRTIDLPLRPYLRATWGIIACCAAGFVAGYGVSLLLRDDSDLVRMLLIGATSLLVTFLLVGFWQKITPRSVLRSLKG
ncbi:MAG TPA: oligosaccharide flippase family protein [Kofleriaceae bacterium]